MDTLSLTLVIIPMSLVALFAYLLFGKRRGHTPTADLNQQLPSRENRTSYILITGLIILTAGGILAFIKFYKMPCPTNISPQEFSEMVKSDMNYKAEIFHSHGFITYCGNCDSLGKDAFLYAKGDYVDYTDGTRELDPIETITSEVSRPGWMRYEIKNKIKFEKFFKYIISIGGKDTLIGANPKHGENFIYNSTIFQNGGFNRKTEKYKIFIANKNSL